MIKKIISAAASAALLFPAMDYYLSESAVYCTSENSSLSESEDENAAVYTVSFLDFNGVVFDSLEVEEGETIDYSLIDTSVLTGNIDKFTTRQFGTWETMPETTDCDITVQALYKEAKIELVSMPERIIFYDKTGKINLSGLKVTITISSQTAELDENGERIVVVDEVVDVAESCYTSPASLDEAFAEQNTAVVDIYPIRSTIPIAEYTIIYREGLGDVNGDGVVTVVDASLALSHFAAVSVDKESSLNDIQIDNCDINRDGRVTATDAGSILNYYALSAIEANPLWENYIS